MTPEYIWQGHGYRIEEHQRIFGERVPLPFALDRLEPQPDGHLCSVNVGWYQTLAEAHRARNADVERRTMPRAALTFGPTVHQAARDLIRRNQERIDELRAEIDAAKDRLIRPKYAHMLESERLATAAEPFQRTPLPENPDEDMGTDGTARA